MSERRCKCGKCRYYEGRGGWTLDVLGGHPYTGIVQCPNGCGRLNEGGTVTPPVGPDAVKLSWAGKRRRRAGRCWNCIAFESATADGHICPVAEAMEQARKAWPALGSVDFRYTVQACPYWAKSLEVAP